jgi:hypothetical protein
VSGVAGLLISRNPSLTVYQVTAALASTARPVAGVAFGRIDPVAAFEQLGLLAPASLPQPVTAPAPAPKTRTVVVRGQVYTRQARLETGTFKSGFRTAFRVGKGRFELQVAMPLAARCTLSLAAPGDLFVAAPAVNNLLSLSLQVPAGRYTAAVRCRGVRTRQFTLGVIAMFPRAAP